MFSNANPKNEQYVNDYLSILGKTKQKPSLGYLSELMEAHLYRVPFDGSNFVLHQPEKFALKNSEILAGFKKKNGSICYQSNGAFKKLLVLLGFDVTLATVTMFRFGRDEPKPYAQMGRDVHCALLVTLGEAEYLVDLVWGNAFRHPLQVGGQLTAIPGEDTRQCINKDGTYQLQVKFGDEWKTEYQFRKENKKTKDFREDINFLCSSKHHLSRELLLMRPLPNNEFEYVWKKIYEEKNGSLFFYHKSNVHSKTISTEIKDKSTAKEKLKEYGVSDENCERLLSICGLSSSTL